MRFSAAGLPRLTDWFVPLNCNALPLPVGPKIHVGLLTNVPLSWLAVLSAATVPNPHRTTIGQRAQQPPILQGSIEAWSNREKSLTVKRRRESGVLASS